MSKKSADQFSKKETEARMVAALRGARISGHKSFTDIRSKKEAENSNRGSRSKNKK